MPQSLSSLHTHIIFSTKNRSPSLSGAMRPRLFEYVGGILRQKKNVMVAANGTADHVHLLISLGRDSSVAEVVRVVKSNSSNWIHKPFPSMSAFAWQSGYGAFAVSFSNVTRVKAYIANQQGHHKRRSFQDEYRAFLNRHRLEYDERYVWD